MAPMSIDIQQHEEYIIPSKKIANGFSHSNGTNGNNGTNGLSVMKESAISGPRSSGLSETKSLTNALNGTSETYDLICVGFGPASLAIAIAMYEKFASPSCASPKLPNILFLEKQQQFAWHAGMQIPGARMQISFLKDMATPRNPQSKFTFLSYLKAKGRLDTFINLGTFLPSRMEYEDYLKWCASHFEKAGLVSYGTQVASVDEGAEEKLEGKVRRWRVGLKRGNSEDVEYRWARHVVIAVGGRPSIPETFSSLKNEPKLLMHSSAYITSMKSVSEVEAVTAKKRFAVVGGGQSAAEIFENLCERFPESEVSLIIKGQALRPSDDSPL